MTNAFQQHYDSCKASRDSCREQGMPFEAALFTRAMQHAAQEFAADVVAVKGDLELNAVEESMISPHDILRDENPAPEDYTLWNKVMECLEKLYTAHNRWADSGVLVDDLMDAYDEWLQ